ncbi:MAG: hypothetical protein HZB46_04315 [Solirubrobacterales bacterium]|nr:hypothetical protein [Solirubrobacterales bacterium]
MPRFRALLATAAVAGLALPAVALATLTDIGTGVPDAKPSCPDRPCLAVSRTTGYQAKVGTNRGLMTVPKDGRLVSWTVSLGKPGKKQVAFFNDKLGGKSQAQITVLRMGRKLHARVVAQGPLMDLEPYFGQTVEFPLERSIEVKKGYVIAVTVPTWAPALAVNLGGDTSWRAARKKGECEDTQAQTAQEANAVAQFYCLYRTARLVYSARVISTP